MKEFDLEKSGLFSVIRDEEEITIDEQLEEFEERLDYIDVTDEKKDKLIELCNEIKKEEKDEAKEYLFKLLMKEVNKHE